MEKSLPALTQWLDRDFFKLGAFLTSYDGEEVTFGKGGSFSVVTEFLESSTPVFYLKDFYQNSYLAYIPESVLTLKMSELNLPEGDAPSFSPVSNEDDLYQKDFSFLKSSFGPQLKKVVLISRENYESFEGESTILHLIKKAFSFGTGMPYGFWNGQYGVIGSTPEILFDVQEEKLQTFALAGTARRGLEEELLNSPKDLYEHRLVIQDIQEKLAPFTQELKVSQTGIHPYKEIVHLRTDITGELTVKTDFTALTNSLSPTAALGGYPKTQAMNFLRTASYGNHHPQRYFGSAFGLMSPDIKEFVVSIRNVQWEGSHLFIECGGGVVPDSVFEKELEEIHLKRNTIRKHYL